MSPASATAAASRKTTSKTASKKVARAKPHAATRLVLLVATRKGAWFFHGDASRKAWKADGPHFLGHTISQVLLDPISQEMRDATTPAFEKAAFVLDYGMKGGALDLEKETILGYFRSLSNPGFSITKLTLRKRIYVFGENAPDAPFVRDICNAAIHTWEVKRAA